MRGTICLTRGVVEKLADAWRNTPTKWYPLPIFVGALLLVAINYRHRRTQSPKEHDEKMHVDRDGNEVIRLRGPLQVRVLPFIILNRLNPFARFMCLVLFLCAISLGYGDMSTPSNFLFGFVLLACAFTPQFLDVTSPRSSMQI